MKFEIEGYSFLLKDVELALEKEGSSKYINLLTSSHYSLRRLGGLILNNINSSQKNDIDLASLLYTYCFKTCSIQELTIWLISPAPAIREAAQRRLSLLKKE